MRQYFSLTTYNKIASLLLIAVIVGLTASRALISVATALLAVNILLHIGSLNIIQNCKKYFYVLSLGLIPLSVMVFLPFSSQFSQGLSLLLHKLPFLIIPLSIILIEKEFLETHLYKFIGLFVLVVFISAIVVLINYLSNFNYYNTLLSEGRPIPTPHEHIRYSLMLSFAGVVSVYMAWKKNAVLFVNDRKIFIFTSIFFFAISHVLSVRIGLVTMYFGLMILILYFIFETKKHLVSVLVLSAFMSAPFVAYYTLPSFQNRINYMLYDFEQLKSGEIGHNSDSRRIVSLQIGLQLFQENTLSGTGAGNIQKKVNETYESLFPSMEAQNRKLPHNQFLYTLVELGVFGGVFLLFAFFTPFFFTKFSTQPLYFILAFIVLISMLVDNTLESQIGIVFYALFSSLFLIVKTEKK